MLSILKELMQKRLEPELSGKRQFLAEEEIRLASAALLVETAISDFDLDTSELAQMTGILKQTYRLEEHEVTSLISQARAQVDGSVSLDQFTKILDINLTPEQKVNLLQGLWEVAYADGSIDKYEEYLIRKLADLLHVSHKGYITAKMRAEKKIKR